MISIIIPNYNHARFLRQRIDSILSQSYQDFELIILDDCSKDGSRGIIEDYKNHSKVSNVIYNENNSRSPFLQWKKGIEVAKGEFIWIAESDDWAENDFLERLYFLIENDTKIALAYTQTFDVNEESQKISRLDWTSDFENNIWKNSFCLGGKELQTYLFIKNVIPNVSACLIRKQYLVESFEKYKRLCEFRMCGDWMMWLLIADIKDVKIAFLNQHLNFCRVTEQSTRNHNTKTKIMNRILEEAIIFNSKTFSICPKTLKRKNDQLKKRWFQTFEKYNWSPLFFKLCQYLSINKWSFLLEFLKSRYIF